MRGSDGSIDDAVDDGMFRLTVRGQAAATLMASSLLAACAAPAPHGNSSPGTAGTLGPVEIGLAGTLPLVHSGKDPLVDSRVGVGGSSDPLRYTARYTLEPGDIFAQKNATPGASSPQRFGSQRLGQELRIGLPEVGGAPVAVHLLAETREQWTTAGDTVEKQRQVAKLDWSPGIAQLNLQWAGAKPPADGSLALGCELRGTLELPLKSDGAAASQALRFSGRECQVLAPAPRYDTLAADTWGVTYAWARPKEQTELLFAMIDPSWGGTADRQSIDASYELGVSHRRDHGSWSASTRVAMRYATAWDLSAPVDETGYYASDAEAYWTASASLTRHLPTVSLSAKWAHGVDPMWFLPEIGQRGHRVDMRLDLSSLVAALAADAVPQLSMQWNWSQARSRSDEISGDTMVRLNMAVAW